MAGVDRFRSRWRHAHAAAGRRLGLSAPSIRLLPLLVLLPLPLGSQAFAGPRVEPWLFRCRVAGESPQLLRIDPRLKQVQELDPGTQAVKRTIRTVEPPPELGGGIIDDSTVTITGKEVSWEESMYRPQFARESRSIDLQTLVFRSTTTLQVEDGPDIAEQKMEGRCERLDAVPAMTR